MIFVEMITGVLKGVPFLVNGKLYGYKTPPHLFYRDGVTRLAAPKLTAVAGNHSVALAWAPVVNNSVPVSSDSIVGTTQFSFRHPAMPAGRHQVTISDGTHVSAMQTYLVV